MKTTPLFRAGVAGLALAAPATLSFKVEDGNVRLAEVEHGPEVAITEWMEGESFVDFRKRVREEMDKLVPEEVGQA